MKNLVDPQALRSAGLLAVDRLRAEVEAASLASAAFAVASADEGPLVCEAFGVADPTTRRQVATDTHYCLASTTKPIAATVLGRLVSDGVLDLDMPIAELVPELPDPLFDAPPPSIRQVADHTAGFGVHHRFFYADESEPVPMTDAVAELARLATPPGRRWAYSNLGYGVLELALTRAAGMSMANLVETHVAARLSLPGISWGGRSGPAGACVRVGTDGEPLPPYVTDHPAASEAWSSIEDLLRFGLAWVDGRAVPAPVGEIFASPSAPRQPDGGAYGLGWVTRDFGLHRLLIHAGQMGGVAAHLVVCPTGGFAVAGLANQETDAIGAAVASVLEAVIDSYAPPEPVRPSTERGTGRWEGMSAIGHDRVTVALDATSETPTISIDGTVHEVVSGRIGRDHISGHLAGAPAHRLVPDRAMTHLDLVPQHDELLGALVFASYPRPGRLRQGDAVSAPVRLRPV